jgi:CelD/BcsL family acetyltransferase involved in cellulose biosynthesis
LKLLAPSDARWRELADERADATVFHHPAWAGLLADCYGYRAMLAVSEGGAALPLIETALPLRRRWVALPFTDACGAFGRRPDDTFAAELRELAQRMRLDALEVRDALPAGDGVQTASRFVRHDAALDGDSRALFKRLRRNHRRNIIDAGEAGIRVVRDTSAQALETFYGLHVQTRRRLGVPVQPQRFFRLFAERILARGLGFVLTAYQGDAPAAAAVFMSWHGTLVCKYSARADRHTRSDAIPLLFWTAMRWGCENGYRSFDLGRTDLASTQLRAFKDGWATTETPLAYSWIARRPLREPSHRLDAAMGVAIRHSRPWFCRAVGELLYRYAG